MTVPMILSPRLQRIRHVLACPECRGELAIGPSLATCAGCGANYSIKGRRIYFVQPSVTSDDLDNFKEDIRRRIGQWYYTVAWIISPCFFVPYRSQVSRAFDTSREIVVDLGSGRLRLDDSIICCDFNDYPEVDLICDIRKLPLKDGAADGFVSSGVLEHVAGADEVVAAMARVTKPGGRGLHLVPFMFPFHASPYDYARWTAPGLRRLFADHFKVRVESASGPFSFFLLGLVEFLSSLVSFGNPRVKTAAFPLFCALTFPLKFFDLLFIRRASFEGMTPLFAVHSEQGRETP